MKEEEQEEEKEEEEETEEARNVDGEQLVKKGSSFPFVSVQVFFNSFFPSSPSPGRTATTHPFVFEKHISEEERVFRALVSSCGFLCLCLRGNKSFHEEETKLWCCHCHCCRCCR
jgi:hypothetical protein